MTSVGRLHQFSKWRDKISGYANDPCAQAYPFMLDQSMRVTVDPRYVYRIERGDELEVIVMPWTIVEEYLGRQPAEYPGWCAMYDCLIQRSEILKSYCPLDKHEKS